MVPIHIWASFFIVPTIFLPQRFNQRFCHRNGLMSLWNNFLSFVNLRSIVSPDRAILHQPSAKATHGCPTRMPSFLESSSGYWKSSHNSLHHSSELVIFKPIAFLESIIPALLIISTSIKYAIIDQAAEASLVLRRISSSYVSLWEQDWSWTGSLQCQCYWLPLFPRSFCAS